MISFDKPEKLNGHQLCDELEAVGIVVNRLKNPSIKGDTPELIFLDIDEKDTVKATEIVAKHIGEPDPEPTIEDKLASVGLTLTDLKSALGL